jgi:hypothetical protein
MQGSEPVRQGPASAVGPAEIAKLQNQRNGGAGWFSAIAVFSIINLLVLAFGGGISFLIGLGITQLIDLLCLFIAQQMDPDAGTVFRVLGGAVTVGIAGLFLLAGMLAKRGHLWAFMAGMVLYALDGLIFLWFQEWLSLGFHVFALLMLAGGLKAQFQLNRLQQPDLDEL